MSLEGTVSVELSLADEQVDIATVKSLRPQIAQHLLCGKKAEDAPMTVSMVFGLCSKAQACASRLAIESATDQRASAYTTYVRQQLVNMETIREHMWRILMDWPEMMGIEKQPQHLKKMLQIDKAWIKILDDKNEAFGEHDLEKIMDKSEGVSVLLELGGLLKACSFYMPPKTFYACEDVEQFLLWSQYTQTGSARFINWLLKSELASVGKVQPSTLPDTDISFIEGVLSGENAVEFIAAPSILGEPFETTPYARLKKHPLLIGLEKRFGVGLLTRFVAVLLEVAAIFIDLEDGLLKQGIAIQDDLRNDNHKGIGEVEAARGRLIHRVTHDDGVINTYQIIAPTEWNFHPEGVLQKALLSLKGDAEIIQQQAKLLIHAMDPCVKFNLEISHA